MPSGLSEAKKSVRSSADDYAPKDVHEPVYSRTNADQLLTTSQSKEDTQNVLHRFPTKYSEVQKSIDLLNVHCESGATNELVLLSTNTDQPSTVFQSKEDAQTSLQRCRTMLQRNPDLVSVVLNPVSREYPSKNRATFPNYYRPKSIWPESVLKEARSVAAKRRRKTYRPFVPSPLSSNFPLYKIECTPTRTHGMPPVKFRFSIEKTRPFLPWMTNGRSRGQGRALIVSRKRSPDKLVIQVLKRRHYLANLNMQTRPSVSISSDAINVEIPRRRNPFASPPTATVIRSLFPVISPTATQQSLSQRSKARPVVQLTPSPGELSPAGIHKTTKITSVKDALPSTEHESVSQTEPSDPIQDDTRSVPPDSNPFPVSSAHTKQPIPTATNLLTHLSWKKSIESHADKLPLATVPQTQENSKIYAKSTSSTPVLDSQKDSSHVKPSTAKHHPTRHFSRAVNSLYIKVVSRSLQNYLGINRVITGYMPGTVFVEDSKARCAASPTRCTPYPSGSTNGWPDQPSRSRLCTFHGNLPSVKVLSGVPNADSRRQASTSLGNHEYYYYHQPIHQRLYCCIWICFLDGCTT